MDQNELKRRAAQAAIAYVPKGTIVGVGTGSTVNCFIAELGAIKSEIQAAVASSEATARLLEQAGIRVLDLNEVDSLSVYVDGADEISPQLHMIKGGGGALTREKIVAAVARQFICICDESKFVPVLGKFPLPVEVIPMARNYVARELAKLGGKPVPRAGVITDNGNVILDVREFEIRDPVHTESAINQIPGVVTCGIFARRGADVLLLATPAGVVTHSAP